MWYMNYKLNRVMAFMFTVVFGLRQSRQLITKSLLQACIKSMCQSETV